MDEETKRRLREGVLRAYSDAARGPEHEHPFPVGREFALELGYPVELLNSLPGSCVEAFSGVSNVSVFAEIPEGATVLDLGCGSGMDALIASGRTGLKGKVIGLDFSESMLDRAREAVEESGAKNVILCRAEAENLPIADESIDVVLVNGIFNLNPFRDYIFYELSRVTKENGEVYAAEIILKEPLPPETISSDSEWFA